MNDIKYQYIPEGIIRSWENEEGKLCSCKVESGESAEVSAENVFNEYLDPGKSGAVKDFFNNEEYRSLFDKLQRGDDSLSGDEKYLVRELMAVQFYCNPFSFGRTLEFFGYDKKYMKTALEAEMRKRSADDILLRYIRAMFYLMYILDLEVVLVSAPGDSSFVLSSFPMIITDPAFGSDDLMFDKPYTANGTILFMPVSPKYAVAAYDSFVYKPVKTNGKLILTPDDVDEYNKAVFTCGDTVVYNPSLTDVSSYRISKPDLWTALFSYSPSVFAIRARYVEVQETEGRAYCGLLEMSDSKYVGENGKLMISEREQIERYNHASKMLEDMKNY